MKKYDNVLFDIDGTLLPMDQDVFIKAYFRALIKYIAPYGCDAEKVTEAVWLGTGAMVKNDGTRTNEAAFWSAFARVYGEKAYTDKPLFDRFYETDFNTIKSVCSPSDIPNAIIKRLKADGVNTVIASSPIFPMTAHKARLGWAGVDPDDFSYISAYENSTFCKPSPDYYTEIARKNGLDVKKCLMVGNDVSEDLPAAAAGMDVFILTDCLINKKNADISAVPHGGMNDLINYLF